MSEVDFTKPVRVHSGQSVRIFTTDASGERPIVGQVEGSPVVLSWYPDGRYMRGKPSLLDLVNLPEAKTAWVNLMAASGYGPGCVATVYCTEEGADEAADFFSRHGRKFLAQLKVTFDDDRMISCQVV